MTTRRGNPDEMKSDGSDLSNLSKNFPSHEDDRPERTAELTGFDATMDEATVGDAGNGLDPYGADVTGGLPKEIEPDPARPDDIVPDQIRRFSSAVEDEESREISAQPAERQDLDASELP